MNLTRNSFSLFDIQLSSDLTIEEILNVLRSNDYDDDKGFGFTGISLEDDYLDALLIKRTPVFIPDYINNKFLKKEIFVYSQIAFAIDITNSFLEIHDTAKQVPKVIHALRKALREKVAVSDYKIFPSIMIPQLKSEADSLVIKKLIINSFKHEDDLIGRYNFSVLNTEKALSLLDEYGHDVVKGIVEVEVKDVICFMEFHSSGRVMIKCEDDKFKDFLGFFKEVLKKQNNG